VLWKQPTAAQGGATGLLQLTSGNVDTSAFTQKLCSATFPEPRPCTVHIRCDLIASATRGRRSWDFPSESVAGVATGSLVFEYGVGATLRRVVLDLRPGSYQLPPCDQVTVYVVAEALPI
jgi:hypothetical protein